MRKSLSLKTIIFSISAVASASSIITSVIGIIFHVFLLNENQVLYLTSTSSQVISGIYGLTLTGFIFFINELNREQSTDETITEPVRELKFRYFRFLLFITTLVGLTLLLNNVAITNEAASTPIINAIILNAGQCLFATSILSITIFIFEVIDPDAVELASNRLKERLDPTGSQKERGILEDFLRNYNEIEQILVIYGEKHQLIDGSFSAISETILSNQPFKSRRRTSNARLAEIMLRNEIIGKDLFSRLKELISLRNSIVHGADPVVSKHIVEESRRILQDLKEAIGK